MNVLITGAKGQLGQSIRQAEHEFQELSCVYTDVEELDITDLHALERYFKVNPFDYVVNCAAYTAVDKAEEERDKARLINEGAVRNLALCADRFQFTLIHISTDYVFDGRHYRPYTEDDLPAPQGVYAETKHAGERAVLEECRHGIVVRTSWLYSEFGHNFLRTILRLAGEKDELKIVVDQVGTPTWAGDLARAILVMVRKNHRGPDLFHFSDEGVASWYDFAWEIVNMSGKSCTVKPIPTEAYPLPAPRPQYSLLSKSKFRDTFGYEIPHWKTSLATCLKNLNEIV